MSTIQDWRLSVHTAADGSTAPAAPCPTLVESDTSPLHPIRIKKQPATSDSKHPSTNVHSKQPVKKIMSTQIIDLTSSPEQPAKLPRRRIVYTSSPEQEKQRFVSPSPDSSDASLVQLTSRPAGPSIYRPLNAKSRAEQLVRSETQRAGIPLGPPRDPSRFNNAVNQSFEDYAKARSYVPSPQRKKENNLFKPSPPSSSALFSMSMSTTVDPVNVEQEIKALADGIIEDMGDVGEESELVDPDGLTCKLLEHQLKAVHWMKSKEEAKRTRAGILADDMGLGKTVTSIALILANRPSRARPHPDAARPPRGTLIVAPVAVVDQWRQELEAKVEKRIGLVVLVHHGDSRAKTVGKMEKADVVITSYTTAANEYVDNDTETLAKKKKGKGKNKGEMKDFIVNDTSDEEVATVKKRSLGILFQAKFHRVILDEAHCIKNRNTKQSKACCALDGKNRWALTGTPIQNGVVDLYALLKFMKIAPFNDYHEFRSRIEDPIKRQNEKAIERVRTLMSNYMLRRTKELIKLPGLEVISVSTDFMDSDEREFYVALANKAQLQVNKFAKAGTLDSQTMQILVLFLRMRQACLHPNLVTKPEDDVENVTAAPTDNDIDDLASALGRVGLGASTKCSVCSEETPNMASDDVCRPCADQLKKFKGLQFSTKIRKLLEVLENLRKEDPKQKTIVFSQFTSFFDILRPFLKKAGFTFVDYNGSMKIDKRNEALTTLRNDPVTTIILCSFKCGSVGLNLTCCNNVCLMDLWWNPALEQQAFDRAHRYGQTKLVRAYRITIKDTVEDRIIALQEQKREIAKNIVEGHKGRAAKLSRDDVLFLFDVQAPRKR